MKTRKLLPLIILAVGAVLALSSCDAMLDAIFRTNQITVDVAVNGTIGNHPDFALPGRYVNLLLTGPGVSASADATWNSYDGIYAHYYFTFTDLPDGFFALDATYVGNIYGYGSTSITMPFVSSSNPDGTGKSVTLLMSTS